MGNAKQINANDELYTIDLLRLAKELWRKAWALVLAGVLCAAVGFSYARFYLTPKYSATAMLYVNNSTFSVGKASFSISSSEISAAQSLVKTYIVILRNRTTLEEVIKRAGVDYTYGQLRSMITAQSVDNTEVFHVTVTSSDPEEAALLANKIAEVLPVRVAEIIDGSSMRLVDRAVVNRTKVSPDITKYAATGLLIGVLLAAAIIVLRTLLDDVIHDEDYLRNTYDLPVLSRVPDLYEKSSRKYGYYRSYGKKG